MHKFLLLMTLLLSTIGCSTTKIVDYLPTDGTRPDRNLVVFLDGTANDMMSRTNVEQLYGLTVNQNRTDLAVFYGEGVGTDGRIFGVAFGWGIGKDVREAYRFLAEQYHSPRDRIFVFGFSRGAFAGRILSGFIETAGLADLNGLSVRDKKRLIDDLYDAHKVTLSADGREHRDKKRSENIAAVYKKWNRRHRDNISIAVLGAWDTIGALGAPNYSLDVNELEKRYVDQICNIEKAFHAVSLDDNRARIYTPVLMTGRHVNRRCSAKKIDAVVTEVWFAGAHSDVGGGYDEGFLSGVSLNWMIAKIKGEGVGGKSIIPDSSAVFENRKDIVHDVEDASFWFNVGFKRISRDISGYLAKTGYNGGKPWIHKSVEERLAVLKTNVSAIEVLRTEQARKNGDELKLLHADLLIEAKWYQDLLGKTCLQKITSGLNIGGYEFVGNCVDIATN